MDAFVVEKKPHVTRATAEGKSAALASAPHVVVPSKRAAVETPVEGASAEELEDELRLFDLDNAYGPFVGVDRLERWKRAERMGLNPPPRVHEILTMLPPKVDRMRESGRLW